jgi:hypothetical protein
MPLPGVANRFIVWAPWAIDEDAVEADCAVRCGPAGGTVRLRRRGPACTDGQQDRGHGVRAPAARQDVGGASYANLGIAMMKIGQHHEELRSKVVGVSATGPVRSVVLETLLIIFLGLKGRLLPFRSAAGETWVAIARNVGTV